MKLTKHDKKRASYALIMMRFPDGIMRCPKYSCFGRCTAEVNFKTWELTVTCLTCGFKEVTKHDKEKEIFENMISEERKNENIFSKFMRHAGAGLRKHVDNLIDKTVWFWYKGRTKE